MKRSEAQPIVSADDTKSRVPPRHPGTFVMERRKQRGIQLTELSRLAGVSASTISRIENGKISPSYGVLLKIGDALDIKWSTVFNEQSKSFAQGCRAISRSNQEIRQETSRGIFEWLATDLATKKMEPILVDLLGNERPPLEGHPGTEEFVYILEGTVEFIMQDYAPLRLESGDSAYFDSSMPHGLRATGAPARYLSISTRRDV